jgi:hypothetical protein
VSDVNPELNPEDFVVRRHPMSRRVVAAVAIVALALSAIGVGLAIAHAEFGPPPNHVEQQDEIPA